MASLVTAEQCGHCGAMDVGTWAAGRSSIGPIALCHPRVDTPAGARPDCYRLVTVYGHEMPCPCMSDPQGT